MLPDQIAALLYANKLQAKLPDNHKFKKNFLNCITAIMTHSKVSIDNLVSEGAHPTDLLFLAAELGSLILCKHIAATYSNVAFSNQTSHILIAVCRNIDLKSRTELLLWLDDNFTNFKLHTLFQQVHLAAASGYILRTPEKIAAGECKDQFGLTWEDYYLATFRPTNNNQDEPPVILNSAKMLAYLHSPLPITGLENYLSTYPKLYIDYNYRAMPDDATLAWYVLYYCKVGLSCDADLIQLLITSNQCINLSDYGPAFRTKKEHQYVHMIQNVEEYETFVLQLKTFSENEYHTLALLISAPNNANAPQLLANIPQHKLNFDAPIYKTSKVPTRELLNNSKNMAVFSHYMYVLYPTAVQDLFEDEKNKMSLTRRTNIVWALLLNKKHNELRAILSKDKEINLTFDFNQQINKESFLIHLINTQPPRDIFFELVARMCKPLNIADQTVKVKNSYEQLKMIDGNAGKILTEKNQEICRREKHLTPSMASIVNADAGELNKLIAEGISPIELMSTAAAMGNILVCNFLNRSYVNELTQLQEIFYAICRCKSTPAKTYLLNFILIPLFLTHSRQPFTMNHILAALGRPNLDDHTKDDLQYTWVEYYIASGHYFDKDSSIHHSAIKITPEAFLRFLNGPFSIQSLIDYYRRFNLTPDFGAEVGSATIGWYITYYTVNRYCSDDFLKQLINCKNAAQLTGTHSLLRQTNKSLPWELLTEKISGSSLEQIAAVYSDQKVSLFIALLMYGNTSLLFEAIKVDENYHAQLHEPIFTGDRIESLSDYFYRHNDLDRIVFHIFSKKNISTEEIIKFCIHMEFTTSQPFRQMLTYLLIMNDRFAVLTSLLDTYDPDKKLLFDLNARMNFNGCSLFSSTFTSYHVSDEIKIALIERMSTTLNGEFRTVAMGNSSNEVIEAIIQKELQLRLNLNAVGVIPVQQAKAKSKSKPKPKAKPDFTVTSVNTKPVVIEPNKRLPESLNTHVSPYCNWLITAEKDVKKISLKFTGAKDILVKLSNLLRDKEFEKFYERADRSAIDRGELVVIGKITALDDLFVNTKFPEKLCNVLTMPKRNPDAKTIQPEPASPVKEIKEFKTPAEQQVISSGLHAAFCDAAEVSINWNETKKQFVIKVDTKITIWKIKGNTKKHIEHYSVKCAAKDIETHIIPRVLRRLDELRNELTYVYDKVETTIFISMHSSTLSSLQAVAQDVEKQFLSWEHTAVKNNKPHKIGLFEKSTATKPKDEMVAPVEAAKKKANEPELTKPIDYKPVQLFRHLAADITEQARDKYNFLKVERVIESGLKYELTYKHSAVRSVGSTHDSLHILQALAKTINSQLEKNNGAIFISATITDVVSIFIYASTAELQSLTDLESLRLQYKDFLGEAVRAAKEKTPTQAISQVSVLEDFINEPTMEPITKPAAKPVEPAINSLIAAQQKLIADDRNIIQTALHKLNREKTNDLANNIHYLLSSLTATAEKYNQQPKSEYYFSYLFSATRLFVTLSHLSYSETIQGNFLHLFRNTLRHAHYSVNFQELHNRIGLIIAIFVEQWNLHQKNSLNFKMPAHLINDDERLINLRIALDNSANIVRPNKNILCKQYHDELKKLTDCNDIDAQQATIMLTALIEQSDSKITETNIYRRIGHNIVENPTNKTLSEPPNLRTNVAEYVKELMTEINKPTSGIKLRR